MRCTRKGFRHRCRVPLLIIHTEVAFHVIPKRRSIRSKGFQLVRRGRQRVVFNIHTLRRIARLLRRICDDHDDRFANPTDLCPHQRFYSRILNWRTVAIEEFHILGIALGQHIVQSVGRVICTRKDGDHTRHGSSSRYLDPPKPCMSMWRT